VFGPSHTCYASKPDAALYLSPQPASLTRPHIKAHRRGDTHTHSSRRQPRSRSGAAAVTSGCWRSLPAGAIFFREEGCPGPRARFLALRRLPVEAAQVRNTLCVHLPCPPATATTHVPALPLTPVVHLCSTLDGPDEVFELPTLVNELSFRDPPLSSHARQVVGQHRSARIDIAVVTASSAVRADPPMGPLFSEDLIEARAPLGRAWLVLLLSTRARPSSLSLPGVFGRRRCCPLAAAGARAGGAMGAARVGAAARRTGAGRGGGGGVSAHRESDAFQQLPNDTDLETRGVPLPTANIDQSTRVLLCWILLFAVSVFSSPRQGVVLAISKVFKSRPRFDCARRPSRESTRGDRRLVYP